MSKIKSYLPQIVAMLFLGVFAAFAWQEPTLTPPGGNVPAPLNVSNVGQSKEGGLILNTGNALNGLIVQFGNVGIGTTAPGAKLEVVGTAKATEFVGGGSGLTGIISSKGLYGWVRLGVSQCGGLGGDAGLISCTVLSPGNCTPTGAVIYGADGGTCNIYRAVCEPGYQLITTGAEINTTYYSCYKP